MAAVVVVLVLKPQTRHPSLRFIWSYLTGAVYRFIVAVFSFLRFGFLVIIRLITDWTVIKYGTRWGSSCLSLSRRPVSSNHSILETFPNI